MKELRCIVFTDREVVSSILDRRRKLRDALPEGDIKALTFSQGDGQLSARIHVTEGDDVVAGEQELLAALVSYCMAKNVPLPVDAEKVVHLIKGKATLMVTMNFQKAARLVAASAERVAPGA